MKNIFLHLCLIASFLLSPAWAYELALTFDDLPDQQDHPVDQQRQINQDILNALNKYHAPAIGFVNEGSLYTSGHTQEKIDILKLWVDNGQPLGNHTYSHFSLHKTPIDEYKQDVLKGAPISKALMDKAQLKYTYFRHPYLHTGTTPEMRSSFETFLKKEDYIIAPATIDTDDWVFNTKLIENPNDKDAIIKAYLDHTRAKFAFYQYASETIFGRNIKHIWLLHANLLNSYAMNDLLKIAQEFGYQFITLDEALKDPVYLSEDNYYEDFGIAWLYRWDYTRGKVVDWSKEPEPNIHTH
jgi:peptidoglycan/xylan/chitin deacetylase (PgdA/CDA1 family)